MSQSVALSRSDLPTDEITVERSPRHSRDLAVNVDTLLRRAGLAILDIEAIIIGVGPGSFTGLRVGLSFVKGLALATGIPAIPVPSPLAVLAHAPVGRAVVFATNAHRGLLYGCATDGRLPNALTVAIDVFTPDAFETRIAASVGGEAICAGDAFDDYSDALRETLDRGVRLREFDIPRASGLIAWARSAAIEPRNAATIEPMYVRRSAAEER